MWDALQDVFSLHEPLAHSAQYDPLLARYLFQLRLSCKRHSIGPEFFLSWVYSRQIKSDEVLANGRSVESGDHIAIIFDAFDRGFD